jgi:hypothetical protein
MSRVERRQQSPNSTRFLLHADARFSALDADFSGTAAIFGGQRRKVRAAERSCKHASLAAIEPAKPGGDTSSNIPSADVRSSTRKPSASAIPVEHLRYFSTVSAIRKNTDRVNALYAQRPNPRLNIAIADDDGRIVAICETLQRMA